MTLTWSVLRAFLRCYDNPHGKDEMEQRLRECPTFGRVWGRQSPRILAGARRVRFPGDGDVDCATWSPPDLVSLHDRPTAPYDGFGERTKSCALSVVSVVVLGGDAIGRGVSSRLDLHGGSRCHGVT
jgi:hypothetical protein